VREALERHEITVVPGFVGRCADGRPTLLGRGGSDFTALFLGHRLGAVEIRLVKDVDGVFDGDPARRPGATARRAATWEEVERAGGGVVQPKALRWAAARRLGFRVAALGGTGTWVGDAAGGPTDPRAGGPTEAGVVGPADSRAVAPVDSEAGGPADPVGAGPATGGGGR
ncbi:MAG TPA: hypothetical protein ENO23_03430, partial [Alphaproteobacteria bacterium]|nr:hypothetical protein [Alphaproteobacteria bacterium]